MIFIVNPYEKLPKLRVKSENFRIILITLSLFKIPGGLEIHLPVAGYGSGTIFSR
jgi:hypothetical protein